MSKRLFISVNLPERFVDDVSTIQADLDEASGLRMTDPNQVHLTLKFLGETDPDRIEEVESAISEAIHTAAVDPFDAEIGGIGAFPSEDYITVVWLGVRTGSDHFTTLHQAIEDRVTELGFEPETHDFTPHLTIARMDHAGGKELVQDYLQSRDPTIGRFTVETIHLTESTLTDDGPVYSTVSSFDL